MPTVTLRSSLIPPELAGSVSVQRSGAPRDWMAVAKRWLKASTRSLHLAALNRLYEAAERQRGTDCLDQLIANVDIKVLENILLSFLVQLGNEAAIY